VVGKDGRIGKRTVKAREKDGGTTFAGGEERVKREVDPMSRVGGGAPRVTKAGKGTEIRTRGSDCKHTGWEKKGKGTARGRIEDQSKIYTNVCVWQNKERKVVELQGIGRKERRY